MNKEEIIKYIFDEENYSNFISSQNGGEKYYILLEKEESKILKDYISNLQDRIDKAIDFLESMDYCGQEDYFCDKTTVDEDPDGNNNSYYDSAERLYKILKGVKK